ncbi:MAG: hypothetical protein WCO56_01115 [Verrucomicrobiota bacterium]
MDKLQQNLIRVARNNAPSDHVPYAFEQRILARLKATRAVDTVALWTQALWRAAVTSVAAMLCLCALSMLVPTATDSLAEDLETTVVAGLNQVDNGW